MNSWKNNKVLVTGGGGFIGSNLVNILLKKQAKVSIVLNEQKRISGIKEVNQIYGDLTSPEFCQRVCRNQEIIFHFAALDGGQEFKRNNSSEIFLKNISLTLNILDAAYKQKVKKILIASSVEIYPVTLQKKLKEEDGLKYNYPFAGNGYVWSKRIGELIAQNYYQKGLPVVIVRPGSLYGPGDLRGLKAGRLIPGLINNMLKNKTIKLFGSETKTITYLYIKDFLEAVLVIMQSDFSGETFNIAGQKVVSLRKLVDLVRRKTKSRSAVEYVNNNNVNSQQINKVSIDKLIAKTNFCEKYNLEQGIEETVEFYQKNL